MEGAGSHQFWEYSPARDYLKDAQNVSRLLVLGPGDIWGTLVTLSRLLRHGTSAATPIEIDIFNEGPIETTARHLLLLEIAFDWEVPIRKRANTLLEVFGNILIQKRTSAYISEIGRRLTRFSSNGEGALAGLVSLGNLKFRQRDELEQIFKFWATERGFNAAGARDDRLRSLYTSRYDVRSNLYDWDYNYGVKPVSSIIHIKQYRHWRDTGVAFEFGEQVYEATNLSLISHAKNAKGRRCPPDPLGFWGDVVLGPYFSIGVKCETPNQAARDLFKIVNKGTGTEQHRRTAVHIAAYNVVSILYEIETGQQYELKSDDDVYSGLGSEEQDGGVQQARRRANRIMCLKATACVSFLIGDVESTLRKKSFCQRYDVVNVSALSAHHIISNIFLQTLRTGARIYVSTCKYIHKLETEKREAVLQKILDLAKSAGMMHCAQTNEVFDGAEYLCFRGPRE